MTSWIREEVDYGHRATRTLVFLFVRYVMIIVMGGLTVVAAHHVFKAMQGPLWSGWTLVALGGYALVGYGCLVDPRLRTIPVATAQVAWRLVLAALLSWLLTAACYYALRWHVVAPLAGGLVYWGLAHFFLFVDLDLFPAAQRRRPRVEMERGQPVSDYAQMRRGRQAGAIGALSGLSRLLINGLQGAFSQRGGASGAWHSGAANVWRGLPLVKPLLRQTPLQQTPLHTPLPLNRQSTPLRPPLPIRPRLSSHHASSQAGVASRATVTAGTGTTPGQVSAPGISVGPGATPEQRAAQSPSIFAED